MLKALVQSNNRIRLSMEKHGKELARYKAEVYELQMDNQNLHNKLALYESSSTPMKKARPELQELLGLRNYCKQLEVQLKYTEFEKLKMAKELNHLGNQEPTRPIFLAYAQRLPIPGKHTDKKNMRTISGAKNRNRSRLECTPSRRKKGNTSTSNFNVENQDNSDESESSPKGVSSRK